MVTSCALLHVKDTLTLYTLAATPHTVQVGEDIRDFCNAHHDEVIVLRIKMESGSTKNKVAALVHFYNLINSGDRQCVVLGSESVEENFTRKTLAEIKGMIPNVAHMDVLREDDGTKEKGSAVIFMLYGLDSAAHPDYGQEYTGEDKHKFLQFAFKYENNENGKYSHKTEITEVVSKQITNHEVFHKCSGPEIANRCFAKLGRYNNIQLQRSINIGPLESASCEECKFKKANSCENPKKWPERVPEDWCSTNCNPEAPKCGIFDTPRKCHQFSHCRWADKFGFWMTSTGSLGSYDIDYNSSPV